MSEDEIIKLIDESIKSLECDIKQRNQDLIGIHLQGQSDGLRYLKNKILENKA